MGMRESRRGGNGTNRRDQCRFGLNIVRTLAIPQSTITDLIGEIQGVLGPAFQPDEEEKGVALLESRAILHAIKDRRGSIDRRMLAEAEQMLVAEVRDEDAMQKGIEVDVNARKPLKMFGRHNDVLALNLNSNYQLGRDRGALEVFMDKYYPCETDLAQRAMPLEPHITLGTIKPQLLPHGSLTDLKEDAFSFINSPPPDASPIDILIHNAHPDLPVPDTVALNGLRIQVETYRPD